MRKTYKYRIYLQGGQRRVIHHEQRPVDRCRSGTGAGHVPHVACRSRRDADRIPVSTVHNHLSRPRGHRVACVDMHHRLNGTRKRAIESTRREPARCGHTWRTLCRPLRGPSCGLIPENFGGADHDVFDLTFAIEEYADLSIGLTGNFRHLTGELRRNNLICCYAARGETLDTFELVVF